MQDRGVKGEVELESVFAHPLMLARRVREQRLHQRGKKIYSLHAPEVECIGNRRQGPSPLRVWRQGLARHHAPSLQGRPVHCPRQGAARQPLQRPSAGDRESGDRDADRRKPCPHRRRPRLSRPQRSARPQVQGLHLGPETPRHRDHQTRTPPPLGGRAGHRTLQGRASHGPKLPRRDGDAANAILAAAGDAPILSQDCP
jgi:hypothetical protein